MILEMAKVRVMGPRERLPDVLGSLQRLRLLHLAAPSEPATLTALSLTPRQQRERRQLASALADVEAAIDGLEPVPAPWAGGVVPGAGISELARWSLRGWRVRRALARLKAREGTLEEERALIIKYQGFFSAFRPLIENEQRSSNATVYHVLLKQGQHEALDRLRTSLAAVIGDAFEIYSRPLEGGETAVLVVVSAQAAPRVERLLAEARVTEIPVPAGYGSLSEALPRMLARLGELPAELAAARRERSTLARAHGVALREGQAAIRQRLQALDALVLSGVTPRAFVLEGWVPVSERAKLESALRQDVGDDVVVSEVSREEWQSEEAPVVLRNPRIFRPFEAIISILPLPRYGTIDPTPFVAVFFPAFFGLMVGDIGYGLVLAGLGLLLHWRSKPGTLLRSVAEVIGPCALFAIVAGFLFGEFFGDLGHRRFGLEALAFNREEAMVPFLLLAVGIGAVHILLGLVLGAASAMRRHHPREAVGRGASALSVVLIIVALLAVTRVLPAQFFTPAVMGLLIAFPVLVIAEGLVGPIELLSTLGNILSYARIMALGVASVMLAVVANRMVGALGSATVGILFALLFHLVNFAIGLFSPAIHALRLHYVEFFGKFYSPGGVRYQPFGGWTREAGITRH